MNKLFHILFLSSLFFLLNEKKIFAQKNDEDILINHTQLKFGYGIETNSSKGFEQQGGSFVVMNMGKTFPSNIILGLETSGMGVQGDKGKLFRLSSGPFIQSSIFSDTDLLCSVAFFKESVSNSQLGGQQFYSQGQLIQWEVIRNIYSSSKIKSQYGMLIQRYSGDFQFASAMDVNYQKELQSQVRNSGWVRGIFISLLFSL